MSVIPPGTVYRFTPFRLDPASFRLYRGDDPVPLAPKALDLLMLLVTRPGAMITKDEIMRLLWSDVAVTDNALTQVVSDLRQALGDDPLSPRYIQTVPRRGYRFIATVETLVHPTPGAHAATRSVTAPPVARPGVRETSNADAYRSFTEGRLKLERMDPDEVPAAIRDFERAIALDPRYAPPYVGLAHARFWLFEASRGGGRPDAGQLAAAISVAQKAADLDPDLSETHAALALMLTAAGRTHEALLAGRESVALDPGNWRNHCRLGVAAWGDERIAAFEQVLGLYPEFAYAHYCLAMVYVARDDRERAREILGKGIPFQDRRDGGGDRFPARGLHWLMGMLHLRDGRTSEAVTEFDRELASGGHELYAMEFTANSLNGRGFAFLVDENCDRAAEEFTRSLQSTPDHARSLLGLADARQRQGMSVERDTAMQRAAEAIEVLRTNGRLVDAEMASTYRQVIDGRLDEAVASLDRLLTTAPPGYSGWLIPLDPFFFSLKKLPGYAGVLDRLAGRAR